MHACVRACMCVCVHVCVCVCYRIFFLSRYFVVLGSTTDIKPYKVKYILSEVFSQDPLEAYFSRQRHKGGSSDNPSVQQFHYNTVSLVQQGDIYRDLKTMNVSCSSNNLTQSTCDAPLLKRKK